MKKLAIEKINEMLNDYINRAKHYAETVNEIEKRWSDEWAGAEERKYHRTRFLCGKYRGYCEALYDMEIIDECTYKELKSDSYKITEAYHDTVKY